MSRQHYTWCTHAVEELVSYLNMLAGGQPTYCQIKDWWIMNWNRYGRKWCVLHGGTEEILHQDSQCPKTHLNTSYKSNYFGQTAQSLRLISVKHNKQSEQPRDMWLTWHWCWYTQCTPHHLCMGWGMQMQMCAAKPTPCSWHGTGTWQTSPAPSA